MSGHNQTSPTTRILRHFPEFGPLPRLFTDPDISRFPEIPEKWQRRDRLTACWFVGKSSSSARQTYLVHFLRTLFIRAHDRAIDVRLLTILPRRIDRTKQVFLSVASAETEDSLLYLCTTVTDVWKQGKDRTLVGGVVRTSVFNWRTFPDLRLTYG